MGAAGGGTCEDVRGCRRTCGDAEGRTDAGAGAAGAGAAGAGAGNFVPAHDVIKRFLLCSLFHSILSDQLSITNQSTNQSRRYTGSGIIRFPSTALVDPSAICTSDASDDAVCENIPHKRSVPDSSPIG